MDQLLPQEGVMRPQEGTIGMIGQGTRMLPQEGMIRPIGQGRMTQPQEGAHTDRRESLIATGQGSSSVGDHPQDERERMSSMELLPQPQSQQFTQFLRKAVFEDDDELPAGQRGSQDHYHGPQEG